MNTLSRQMSISPIYMQQKFSLQKFYSMTYLLYID